MPDLYIVGLQEMVNLDILGSLACTKDVERMHGWESLITRSLNYKANQTGTLRYGCLLRKVMLGCNIMLFVRSDHYNSIKNMHTVKIKTGTSGYTANKGSVAIRFNFEDTSFMFLNCHLCSGQKQVQQRLSEIKQTYSETLSYFNDVQETTLSYLQ